jgi:hypothetical protein
MAIKVLTSFKILFAIDSLTYLATPDAMEGFPDPAPSSESQIRKRYIDRHSVTSSSAPSISIGVVGAAPQIDAA